MKKFNNKSIADNIKKQRMSRNMTQSQIAYVLHLDTQYYAQLERGERNFTVDKIVAFCSYFDIGIDQIIVVETEKKDVEPLKQDIISKLNNLNYNQTYAVNSFIDNITPFIN